jgi:hypothetical protein
MFILDVFFLLKNVTETWFYVFDSATKSKAQVGQAICCAEIAQRSELLQF